ncbi:MAG: hypothetical protein FJY11_10105, partial [Bacteroidetes bacterium]|nr:hypothetical protein [Bacteroidota bacterium]
MKYQLSIPSFLLLMFVTYLTADCQTIDRVEPPSWFTGMEEPVLQLMVHGSGIASFGVTTGYPGLTVSRITKTGNPDYLFIDLHISEKTLPGEPALVFSDGKTLIRYNYRLDPKPEMKMKGFDASDVIYLIMPDRFANGNSDNDNVEGMKEIASRKNPAGRHGGDLAGIAMNLDYLSSLGVTGIWLNPFLENNQPAYSYHGYSTTDFYRVDPRYGTNDE